MSNIVEISGRLGADPDIYEGKYGKIANFTIAFKYGKYSTGWLRVCCYKDLADTIDYAFKKGTGIKLFGYLAEDSWQDKDGKERSRLKLVATEIKIIEKGEKS